jgi:hypothetical protein
MYMAVSIDINVYRNSKRKNFSIYFYSIYPKNILLYKCRAVKFTLLYLLFLTLLLILFTNSPKPGKLTYLPVKIKTKIY